MSLHVQLRKHLPRPRDPLTVEVEFAVDAGFTILLGPSGAGKTTILNCIAGMSRPDSGCIRLNRRLLFGEGVDVALSKRKIGYVFQDLALFPHLSVERNVGFGLDGLAAADRSQKVAEILAAFAIPHLAAQRPAQLSAGERQRVALARTLVTGPDCLLLDEPLSALDEDARDRLVADLRAWNAQHRIPIVYVTHSRAEAIALGENAMLLQNGRLAASGSPVALFRP